MKPELSVVIPAYNESGSIPALFEAMEFFSSSVDFSIQYVFVDDGSVDDTFDRLSACSIEGIAVKVVKLSRNFGAHAAIRAGIHHADADYVVVYSMDMPEPIEDIALFYNELESGTELVYSERIGYKGSLGSRIFGRMINKFIEPSYPSGGLIGVGFGPKIKKRLEEDTEKNSSIFFQLFQLGFSRKGIPATYNDRSEGESKWTFRKKVKLFIDSFVMFSYMPIRAISIMGIILALLGILWALGIIICKAFNLFTFATGFPTTMAIILVGFGVTNVSLGIIAEYLVRTLDAARERPVFITDEVVCRDYDKIGD